MSPQVEAVTASVGFGEGPHWDSREQALYFVCFTHNSVHKHVPATESHTSAKLHALASFIIPIEGKPNHFVVGVKREVLEISWDGTQDGAKVIRVIAEVDPEHPMNQFNDGKADPRGRLFAGTLDSEFEKRKPDVKKGSLYRFDHDGSTHKLASNIDLANGLVWDVKEKAFYYIDSSEGGIRRYDYDIETGDISNPRIVFKFAEYSLPGFPDGMTIDMDGNLWVANFDGYQVLKVDPRSSKLLQKVPIPAQQTTSCTFGGPNLDVLYVTTGAMNRGEEQKPPCGSTFKVTGLGVRGHHNVNVRLD